MGLVRNRLTDLLLEEFEAAGVSEGVYFSLNENERIEIEGLIFEYKKRRPMTDSEKRFLIMQKAYALKEED